MRLDHLLSRERSEGRDAGADFQVEGRPRGRQKRKRSRRGDPEAESGRKAAQKERRRTTVPLLTSVSFSMSRGTLRQPKRKRGCAHLDNRTTEEREKTLKRRKGKEGQLRAVRDHGAGHEECRKKNWSQD